MRVPDWWTFLLLTLGVFRIVRLIGWDDLSTGMRARVLMPDAEYWVVARYVDQTEQMGGDPWSGDETPRVSRRRFYTAKLVHCPFCSSWWAALAMYAMWWWLPHVTLLIATVLASSLAVGLLAKNLDP